MSWTSILSGLAAFLGSGSVISGIVCIFSHLSTGDLGTHWQECLALVTAGTAVASPGLNALKAGVFKRPPPQQTKDPLTGERH